MKETRAIKEQEVFFAADENGDARDESANKLAGLFCRDTRFLSRWELTLNGLHPVLLSSGTDEPYLHDIWLTNPDLAAGALGLARGRLGIHRQAIVDSGLIERVAVTNYHNGSVQLELTWEFAADFRDVFELRGAAGQRGAMLQPEYDGNSLTLGYRGLDTIERWLRIGGTPTPTALSENRITYQLDLSPGATREVEVHATPVVTPRERDSAAPSPVPSVASVLMPRERGVGSGARTPAFQVAREGLAAGYAAWEEECTRIITDNPDVNRVLRRSLSDLRLLTTHADAGPYLVAGLPKFGTLFGRDSILAAAQTLTLNPNLARGTLRALAALQGQEVEPWRDEQPGKILHEVRQGELANLGLVPFGRYYGSIDSTPLFIILLAETYRWTGDIAFMQELAEPLSLAVAWLDTYGDPDGDGYLEYLRRTADGTLERGLVNQGWKDSSNSLVFADGRPAQGPAAPVEVQAYAHAAKLGAAGICDVLGDRKRAACLRREADDLKERFDRDFWMDGHGFFALALDGEKQQVDAVTSNPGHALWTGTVKEERLGAFVKRLMSEQMLSPWGLRTLAAGQAPYNPVSYHNGSIWPHDNSIIALGLKRYGLDEAANAVVAGVLRAATHFPGGRLPELYCGYGSSRPIAYPDACSPQAWAAGAVFMAFQAMLGLFPASGGRKLYVRPHLLPEIAAVEVKNLRVGAGRLDFTVQRKRRRCDVKVTRNDGDVEIVVPSES